MNYAIENRKYNFVYIYIFGPKRGEVTGDGKD
jgi:hypothetical protein